MDWGWVARTWFWAIGLGWIMTYCSWPGDDRCLLHDPKPQTHPLLLWVVNRMSCLSIVSWCLWPQKQPGVFKLVCDREKEKERGTGLTQKNKGIPPSLSLLLDFSHLIVCPLFLFFWCFQLVWPVGLQAKPTCKIEKNPTMILKRDWPWQEEHNSISCLKRKYFQFLV